MKSTAAGFSLFLFLLLGAGSAGAGIEVKGTGTAAAAELFAAWIKAYGPPASGIQFKYEPHPGRGGIQQWLTRGADFALSEMPLSVGEEKQSGGNLLYLPVGLTAAVVVYNLPAVPGGLQLTPRVLSSIFSWRITRWNDPALRELNPDISLPALPILVLHREDEGSLYDLFPSFLKNTDNAWATEDGPDRRLKWPVGTNVRGNAELYRKLREAAGSIGIVDLFFANQNHLPAARLGNAAGRFTGPTLDAVAASVADLTDLPEDLKVFISRPRDPAAYPLCSFLWVLVRPQAKKGDHDFRKPKALADFLGWLAADGQRVETEAGGIALPDRLRDKVLDKIKTIQTEDLPGVNPALPAAPTMGTPKGPTPPASSR